MNELSKYLPQPATWFSKTLEYQGVGRIEFSSPQGWIEGHMTCQINHIGEMTVQLKIQDWENNENLSKPKSKLSRDWIILGRKPSKNWIGIYTYPQSLHNIITNVSLHEDAGGIFTSHDITHYTWEPITNIIELHIDKAVYIAKNQTKSNTKYWILPCINLNLKPVWGSISAITYRNLRYHPLRIFPMNQSTEEFLSSDAPKEDKAWVMHNLTAINYIVPFFYNQEPAFIERLPEYEQITTDLTDGLLRLSVTSLMIGEYISEEKEMHPVDLLPVLGFATGRSVGASWIEFRDEMGKLVYRIHTNLGRYTYGRGRTIVNDLLHSQGLIQLLSLASNSDVVSDSLIRGAFRSIAKAISANDVTIIFYYTFTTLDALFKYYGINQKIPTIKSRLTSNQICQIEHILEQTQSNIKKLTNNLDPSSAGEQIDAINRIANNARSQPLNKNVRFGDMLVALLTHLDFKDIAVLSVYYPTIEDWIKKVTNYRNTTMHETHYRDVFNPDTRKDVEQIMPHLIDIVLRVMLKTINYTGNYSRYMDIPDSYPIDWVQKDTTPRNLGYK